ncbi:uncharacterized protein LOC113563895 [Drosophila erecta]|uniref:uncharacterized protein LOC113563895 n=1 Tax=Drosophila erecta TaxID=7220 RepID=UPI0001780586|nr:uncharacterized protein LOC113563895 [Drosophila erecta]
MATNLEDQGQAYPHCLLVDPCILDFGRSEHKKEPLDSDFSMSSDRLAFQRAESIEDSDPHQNSVSVPSGGDTPLKDPHPSMKCCGRNFTRSIFYVQPDKNPRPGLTRRRRGYVHVRNQTAP